ncbi:MAG: hypothetical protein A3I78_02540 [Gammaproteobacteria bacterium RIFCSPLOWO2_02_FULL_56_15]|nr:MAG: hypothetical protein A3F68_08635 [Acidobacteria bacterium RIFCSPLOWO2_12_FULL_54_10]OGT71620.1 MAG: hypothetical protein A3I78_02540 [Gammaproteobacteria bacterium RIFCSPLOWO2_02_FULL_56_15]
MLGSTQLGLSQNQILAALSREETKDLLPSLELISLRPGEILYRPGAPMRYVYFPLNSVVYLLASMGGGRTVEVNLIGEEGMLGLRAVLGAKTSGKLAAVHIPGSCLRIKANVIQAQFKRCGGLHDRLLRYTRYLLCQISQTAACNRGHLVEQRLARWLLMVHDRAKKDEFPITHALLSDMLGTPRSEVTLAAGMFRKADIVRYVRGRITILNRRKLESTACQCYRIVSDELDHPI